MAEAYQKQTNAPLAPPDLRLPLGGQKQLPENVMWLPDGRGCHKRPGSLPYAFIDQSTSGVYNWITALITAPTNSSKLSLGLDIKEDWSNQLTTEVLPTAKTVLAYKWGPVSYGSITGQEQTYGLFPIENYRAFLLSSNKRLMRGQTRTDPNYYWGDNTSQVAVTNATQIGEISSGTIYTAFSQQNIPAITLTPEERYNNVEFKSNKLINAHRAVFSPGAAAYAPLDQINVGRVDIVPSEDGLFIGGGGGPAMFFDGVRNFIVGPYPMNGVIDLTEGVFNKMGLSLGTPVAGSLTGTFKYFITHVYKTTTGEIVEGVPSSQVSATVSSKNIPVAISDGHGSVNTGIVGYTYKMRSFACTTTEETLFGSVKIVITGFNDIKTGDRLAFFTSSNRVGHAVVANVASDGQTVHAIKDIDSLSVDFSSCIFVSVDGWFRIYRTENGGSTFFLNREVCAAQLKTIGDGSIFTDSLADATLITHDTYEAPAFTPTPTSASTHALALHQERLVALTAASNSWYYRLNGPPGVVGNSGTVNPQAEPVIEPSMLQVQFSPASSRHYFPPENSFFLPSTCGRNKPMALVSVNDVLYIFTSDSISYVQGSLGVEGGFSVQLLTDQLGCRDARSVVRIGTSVYFVSQLGLTRLQGTSLSYDEGSPIRTELLKPDTTTACYFWREKNLLLVSANQTVKYQNDEGSDTFRPEIGRTGAARPAEYLLPISKPRTFVYSFVAQKWSVWNIDCFNGAIETEEGDLVIAPALPTTINAATTLIRLSDKCNFTDSGTAFTARYYSPWFDDGQPGVDKTYNRLDIFSTNTDGSGGQGFSLTVKTEKDWIAGATLQEAQISDFEVNGSYGNDGYAELPYGNPERPYKVLPLNNQKAKSLRVILENNEPNGDFCINALAIESANSYMNMKDL